MYKAMIAKIDKTIPIKGADRIHIAVVLGEYVIVTNKWNVGKKGVFFPADTQLSDDFCKYNNLYRDVEKNIDDKTGFFDNNRRVRCQPFMKVKSEGFFCDEKCFDYLNTETPSKIGDTFNKVNEIEICKKYISPQTARAMKSQKKKTKIIDVPNFSKHVDTEQFKYNIHKIEKGSLISIHSKRHGTSARYSLTKVVKKPKTIFQKILNRFNLFNSNSYEYLTGSRNVILYPDQYREGFHGSEQFRFDIAEQLKPYLIKDMIIYGEIVGFVNGSPIMGRHSTDILKDKKIFKKYGKTITYTYNCKEHEFKFHIYRISISTDDIEIDFTDAQCKKWCEDRGFEYAKSVHEPFIYDGNAEALTKLVTELTERPECLCEDYTDSSHVSEGIVLRIDDGNTIPTFLKSKSYFFKCLEGIYKEDHVDTEDAS